MLVFGGRCVCNSLQNVLTFILLWRSHLLSKWTTVSKRQQTTHILIVSVWYLTVCLLVLRAADAVLTGLTENIIAFHMKNISNSKDKAHLLLVQILTVMFLDISAVNRCVIICMYFFYLSFKEQCSKRSPK